VLLIASLLLVIATVLPFPASAWNIAGHMLSAAIAYQILQQENPPTIRKGQSRAGETSLVRKPMASEASRCPATDRDMVLFMQAARWADEIRTNDKQQHRALWHYINWPFKPEGQPASVHTREPEQVNILTAMAENERA